MWQWRHATDRLQLLRAEGNPSPMVTALASDFPYALFIFRYRRRCFDACRCGVVGRTAFVMLQHPSFLHPKWCIFCSNVRFWAFSASVCAMRLRRHFVGCDAGCAYLRKVKKGRCPATWCPVMAHTAANVTPGLVWCFEGDIWGNFTGKNVA